MSAISKLNNTMQQKENIQSTQTEKSNETVGTSPSNKAQRSRTSTTATVTTTTATPQPESLLSIANASKLINDKLLVKGFFSNNPSKLQKILFLSTDYDELLANSDNSDYLQGFELNETIYKNDKNVINIVYALLTSIDSNSKSNETIGLNMRKQDRKITNLNQEVERLKKKIDHKDRQIQSLQTDVLKSQLELKDFKAKYVNISKKNTELEKNFKVYSDEVTRELRRNNIEIESLESKLQNTLKRKHIHVSTKHTYSKSIVLDKPTFQPAVTEGNRQVKRIKLNNDKLVSIIEENNMLKEQISNFTGFSLNVREFLVSLNEFMNNELHPNLVNGVVISPPQVPDTFILQKDELLKYETSKISIEQIDQQFVDLMRNIQYEQYEDTFQFKKQKHGDHKAGNGRFGSVSRDGKSVTDTKQEEINELNDKLMDMTKNYEKLLDVVSEYREYFKKGRKT
ncbi:unnamed protein product [Ambrosiozyma monospora]|uniref:Unnamed protein product n=2 Tax=Ambrosiozyma monospora TaxID=43982 RepID=A0A9W6YX02_AMBMO|nr:unnamed protein product [Ambrosiozyma monospora]